MQHVARNESKQKSEEQWKSAQDEDKSAMFW